MDVDDSGARRLGAELCPSAGIWAEENIQGAEIELEMFREGFQSLFIETTFDIIVQPASRF